MRCGIIVNVTPWSPELERTRTLEFSNSTPLPAKIYANEGVAQVTFESDEVCVRPLTDVRGGKYHRARRAHAAQDLTGRRPGKGPARRSGLGGGVTGAKNFRPAPRLVC